MLGRGHGRAVVKRAGWRPFLLAIGMIAVAGSAWGGQDPAPGADDPEPRTVMTAPEPLPEMAPGVPATGEEAAGLDSAVSDPTAGGPVAESGSTVGRQSLIRLFRQANFILWPLLLCSIVALAFAMERFVALRRGRVLPKDFSERLLERVSAGKIDRERALELCKANDCPLARVFGRIVQHWGAPTSVLMDVADREIAAETQDLKRNVRLLNGTATLSPLLGLLGTVVGMVEAFDSLTGDLGGMGKNEALAHGISVALLATAMGLVIAILSVIFYYALIHRADVLGRALELDANRLIDQVAGDGSGTPLVELRR